MVAYLLCIHTKCVTLTSLSWSCIHVCMYIGILWDGISQLQFLMLDISIPLR